MRKLTQRQQETLDFIKWHIQEKGHPPTFREIGCHLGVREKAAYDHVAALQKKGYVEQRGHSIPRGIRVLPAAIEHSLYVAKCNISEHGIEKGDYIHAEDGYVVALTRPIQGNLQEAKADLETLEDLVEKWTINGDAPSL